MLISKLRKFDLQAFVKTTDGNASLDFVVITAFIAAIAVAVTVNVRSSAAELSGAIDTSASAVESEASFASSSSGDGGEGESGYGESGHGFTGTAYTGGGRCSSGCSVSGSVSFGW